MNTGALVRNNKDIDPLSAKFTAETSFPVSTASNGNLSTIQMEKDEEPFMVLDVGDIVWKYNCWRHSMPRVEPFYAMKCNSDPMVLNILAALGVGFDCASKIEIGTVLKLGVSPSRIIYANPCKSRGYIQYAATMGVDLMTFDSEMELHKIKTEFSNAKLVIRIKVDDSGSLIGHSRKFGCQIEEVPFLLQIAKNLSLNVVGVSFHVGTDVMNPCGFSIAIALCRHVFDIAEKLGYCFKILDIGGGYPGKKELFSHFAKISSVINEALDVYFPSDSGVRIIAEPGKYFVGSACTLYVNVIGRRQISLKGNEIVKYEYFINEGIYGSFRFSQCPAYYKVKYTPIPVKEFSEKDLYPSILWGPTCDSRDHFSEEYMLPKLEIGDWIMFNNMGDYTVSMSCTFNGFPKTNIKYIDPLNVLSSLQMDEFSSKKILKIQM